MDSKPFWASKTIWFNIGTFLVTIGSEFAVFADFMADEYQQGVRLGVAVTIAVGNVILRTITHKPIGGTQ